MRIAVDSGGYVSAVDEFYQANHGVVDAVSKLAGTLGASGGMAGNDTGGQAWAEQYDDAAAPLVEAGCQLGEAMAQMANLLNASLSNHEGADYGSRVYGPPVGGSTPDDPNPDHYSETLSSPAPPSAYGGTGDVPGWWHWIAGHVGGLVWPDADTGQLRAAGDAWRTAGEQIGLYTAHVDSAGGQIGLQRSPEVSDVVATCNDLSSHIGDLSSACTSIGQACSDYATQVDEHHQEIESELKSFIEWTIGIEVGGAVLGAVTLGIGEAAAQAAEAAKVAQAAAKVISILNRLIELARLAALRIGELVAKAVKVTDGLKGLLGARTIKALEETGEVVAKGSASHVGDLPKLAGSIAESFEGGQYTTQTFEAGTVFYRAEGSGQGVGSFFGLVKPGSAAEAEEMFNIAKWGNPAEVVSTYTLREDMTMYVGDVAGGTGEQALIPRSVSPSEMFEKMGQEVLK